MNQGLSILKNCCLMAIDYNHAWWTVPPFKTIEDKNLHNSYTLRKKGNPEYTIFIRRKYDLIHELIHIAVSIIDYSSFEDETLANISESFELLSLELWPIEIYKAMCT